MCVAVSVFFRLFPRALGADCYTAYKQVAVFVKVGGVIAFFEQLTRYSVQRRKTENVRHRIHALVGEKVSIVSPKPQTTRDAIMGVLTKPDYQIVFVDTPGIYRAKNRLSDMMTKTCETAAKE